MTTDQPRKKTGRYDSTAHREAIEVDLGVYRNLRDLMSTAQELSNPDTVAATSPDVIADFARRVQDFLIAPEPEVDQREEAPAPDDDDDVWPAPAPGSRIAGKLGMLASSGTATGLFTLPPGTRWEKVHDGLAVGRDSWDWTIVRDPHSPDAPPLPDAPEPVGEFEAADYTIDRFGHLVGTMAMATRNATATGKAQTIDYPDHDGQSWSRVTVRPGPDGISYQHGLTAPHQRDFDDLLPTLQPAAMRNAAYVIEQHAGNLPTHTVAYLASCEFPPGLRDRGEAAILAMLDRNPRGAAEAVDHLHEAAAEKGPIRS